MQWGVDGVSASGGDTFRENNHGESFEQYLLDIRYD